MLGVNQLDFINYCNALKGNYRKGVHKMETLLENPTHAKEFAKNLGGVSVVLGTPVGKEDRNSETLRSMLLASDVANDAVYTWMGQYYEFDSWDELLGDGDRCKAMMANELMWRAAGGSKLAVGKSIATLAGLSCADYADIDAVAASQVAMTAVAASQVAMAAVASSQVAMAAIIGNSTALNAVVTSQVAMTAVAASQVAMAAIVKSPVAMAAMWRSDTAIKALQANATAWKTFTGATSAVIGKTVAILANLDPSGYADMTAIAASQVAMAAVAASNTATKAIAASQTALNAIAGSTTALDVLYAKKSRLTGASASKSGKFIILQISNDSVFNTSKYGYATLSDGSQPSWESYKGKYAFFMQYKKIATYIKNDTEGDDWIDYFPCG